jgi:glycosidase
MKNKKMLHGLLAVILGMALVLPQISFAATPTSNTSTSWMDTATIYEVNVRQYTKEGTFNAFSKHLTRLSRMGIKVLWFMPIHKISVANRKGSLGSYYAVADYKSVNPEFGTKEDFKALVDYAHSLGFKVVLDWVANHTGMDNVWTVNKSWYSLGPNGELMPPTGTDWTDVAELNYDNPDMRAAMIDAMKYWVKDFGIDGYRCDVAGNVPNDFWQTAIKQLRTIKPVFMLAEANNNKALLQTGFNADYGWEMLGVMNKIGLELADSYDVEQAMANQADNYPAGKYPMQFITNHDENSWNGTEYERLGDGVVPLTALSFTIPGMPLIYSGQESAFKRRLAFFEKDQIDWGNYSQSVLFAKLTELKRNNKALWNGSAGGPYKAIPSSNAKVLTFERNKGTNRVVVVMNLSSKAQKAKVTFGASAGKYKVFTATKMPSTKPITLAKSQTVSLKPWAYEIYTK